MAENIRNSDPRNGDLTAAHAALVKECREQGRNTLYTSTSFFIWLRTLKIARAVLWVLAAASGAAAASTVLTSRENMELVIAGLALLAVILPGATKALNLDDAIKAYAEQRWRSRAPKARYAAWPTYGPTRLTMNSRRMRSQRCYNWTKPERDR